MMRIAHLFLLLYAVMGGGIYAGAAVPEKQPLAWWVWNRTQPLTETEARLLRDMGSTELLWNVGTLERQAFQWKGAETFRLPAPIEGVRFVPVVRLHHSSKTLEEPAADEAFIGLMVRLCEHFKAGTVQVDYDCPDRLLPRYADLMGRLQQAITPVRLSVTALAGWPQVPGFSALCSSVDELAPMFYDLESDAESMKQKQSASVAPLLAPATVVQQLQRWKHCPISWRAGLPNFTRVTLFDPAGLSQGHLAEWHWESLVFHPALKVETPTREGMTALRAQEALVLDKKTPVAKGAALVVRWPDMVDLQSMMQEAHAAGAAGTVLFKLPQEGAPSGWSLKGLSKALTPTSPKTAEGPPALSLQYEGSRLILSNADGRVLPPRFATEARTAGWSLELDVPIAVVGDLTLGDFSQRDAGAEKSSGKVTLRFAHLPAGGRLSTGYCYFQTPSLPAGLRWRVLELSPVWHSAAPSPSPSGPSVSR